jgi:ATP-dependent Zn protease
MGGAEGGVMSFARSRAKIYADDEVKVRFSDVAGVDEAEEELKEIVEFLKQPKKYTNLGGRIPRACSSSDRRAPARRCWRAQSPARRTCPSSA